jgi:translation initiation factor IF-3
MDLVIISRAENELPVARIIDWTKFKYQLSKKRKNSKTVSGEIKEWWFYPKITDHDIGVKLGNVEKYLKKGGRVKLTVKFKRRVQFEDMQHTMNRLKELSSVFAEPTADVSREGGNLVLFIKLKK